MQPIYVYKGGQAEMKAEPLYTIPIEQRPKGNGPISSKIFFPVLFFLGTFGIHSSQWLALPLLLIPFGYGQRWFDQVIGVSKDGYGRLRRWTIYPHPPRPPSSVPSRRSFSGAIVLR